MTGRKKIKDSSYIAGSINRLIDKEMQSGDFTCGLPSHAGSEECRHLFLNIYDATKIRRRFDEIGLSAYLKNKGFSDIRIDISRESSFLSRLCVYDKAPSPNNLLVDTRFSETYFTPFKEFCEFTNKKNESCTFHLIVIEWIETIDPKAEFTPERPQLPGQQKPGLGILSYIKRFLTLLGKDIARDGFMKIADHVH